MNWKTVILPAFLILVLCTGVLSSGCTGGTADVHLNSSHALAAADDENMTASFDVVVTAENTGTVKARDLIVRVTMQQLLPGDTWEERVAGSDLVSASIPLGTLSPGEVTTANTTMTLQGSEESYALLKEGVYIEVMTEVAQVSYYSSSWLDFL